MNSRSRNWIRRSALAAAALGVAVSAFGQQPPRDRPGRPPAGANDERPPAPDAQQAVDLTGTIQSFNYGPRGEIEGFMLKTGDKLVQVNAPRDAGSELSNSLKIGSDAHVKAIPEQGPPPPPEGNRGPRPGGRDGGHPGGPEGGPPDGPDAGPGPRGPVSDHPVYRLESMTGRDGQTQQFDGPESRKFVHIEGTIKELNYGRRGEVNGVQLDSGDLVHLPPEAARDLKLAGGQKLTIDGFAHPMLNGNHQAIQAVAVNGQGVGEEPQGPRGKGPGHDGPRHRPKGPPPGGPDGAGPGNGPGPDGQGPGPDGQDSGQGPGRQGHGGPPDNGAGPGNEPRRGPGQRPDRGAPPPPPDAQDGPPNAQ